MEKFNQDNMFYCFGCGYLLDEPSESLCCGYLYCQACILDFASSLCSVCKKAMKFRKNLWAKNIMLRMEIKCRYKCGGLFKYEELRKHLLQCQTKKYKCKIDGCRYMGNRKEVDIHLKEKHLMNIFILMENFEEFKDNFEKIQNKSVDSRMTRTEYCPVVPYSSSLMDDNLHLTYYNFRDRIRREDPMLNHVFGDILNNRYRPGLEMFERNLIHEEEYAYLNNSMPSEAEDELF
jgi:hypothetical protein